MAERHKPIGGHNSTGLFQTMQGSNSQARAKLSFLNPEVGPDQARHKKTQSYDVHNVERDMLDQLQRYKHERSDLKEKKAQQQEELVRLLSEAQGYKDRELRGKIEIDRIKVSINNRGRNGVGHSESQAAMEKLLHERQRLLDSEEEFVQQVLEVDRNLGSMNRGQSHYRSSSLMCGSVSSNQANQSNARDMEENLERINQLKKRGMQLEDQRHRIMNEVETVKQNDTGHRKNNSGLMAAGSMLRDSSNDSLRIQTDANTINRGPGGRRSKLGTMNPFEVRLTEVSS